MILISVIGLIHDVKERYDEWKTVQIKTKGKGVQ